MPDNPIPGNGRKPRWLNVVTTGNVFSIVAAFVGSAPAIVLLWNIGQWPLTVGRQIDTLVKVTTDLQAILAVHEKQLADNATQLAAIKGELLGLELNIGKASK